VADAESYRELGEAAWAWVLRQVRDDDGPWLPDVVTDEAPTGPAADRDSLYAGIAGLAPVLAEIRLRRALTEHEQELADGIVARLGAMVPVRDEASLYDGLGGDATALRMLAPGREQPALARLAALRTEAGWRSALEPSYPGVFNDVVSGTAGVVLAALWAGAAGTAEAGGESLLGAALPAGTGLDWRMKPGYASSSPNFSHGTAGAASALAVTGKALGRKDFVDAAQRGAEHLLSVAWHNEDEFVVPHTMPYSTREVEPVTWNWCHGPAGTSQFFAALAYAGVDEVGGYGVSELRRRCLRTVLAAGVPQRLRPGFWDNDGRCCGTAGVGDILLDAAQDDAAYSSQWLEAARVMGDALAERAIRDGAGAYWRFVEYRKDPPLLPPGTSWMQGAAGIAAFLLRLARIVDSGLSAPVVDRPDQWWAVPARLRTVHSGA
jgi:hypothetical protein